MMVLLLILFLRFINITLGDIGDIDNVVDAAYSFPKIFFTRFKTIGEDEDEDDDEDKVADIIRRLASMIGKYVCICTVCTRCMLYIILSAIFVSIFRPN